MGELVTSTNEQYAPEEAGLPVTLTVADHYEGIRQAQEAAWAEGFADGTRQDAEGDDGPRFTNPYAASEWRAVRTSVVNL